MITPKLTLAQAQASMKPATDFATALLPNLSVPLVINIQTHANYLEYYNSAIPQALSNEGVGTGVAMASRLISTQNFATPAKKSQLIDTFTNLLETAPILGSLLMVPPKNLALPETDLPGGPGESSLNPAWRTSYYHSIFETTWNPSDTTYGGFGSAAAVYNATTRTLDPLRAITPEAAYQNEGDTYEPNPEESFWGTENYERLLRIKKEVDPGNILTCHQCVGWNEADARFGCYPKVR